MESPGRSGPKSPLLIHPEGDSGTVTGLLKHCYETWREEEDSPLCSHPPPTGWIPHLPLLYILGADPDQPNCLPHHGHTACALRGIWPFLCQEASSVLRSSFQALSHSEKLLWPSCRVESFWNEFITYCLFYLWYSSVHSQLLYSLIQLLLPVYMTQENSIQRKRC